MQMGGISRKRMFRRILDAQSDREKVSITKDAVRTLVQSFIVCMSTFSPLLLTFISEVGKKFSTHRDRSLVASKTHCIRGTRGNAFDSS